MNLLSFENAECIKIPKHLLRPSQYEQFQILSRNTVRNPIKRDLVQIADLKNQYPAVNKKIGVVFRQSYSPILPKNIPEFVTKKSYYNELKSPIRHIKGIKINGSERKLLQILGKENQSVEIKRSKFVE